MNWEEVFNKVAKRSPNGLFAIAIITQPHTIRTVTMGLGCEIHARFVQRALRYFPDNTYVLVELVDHNKATFIGSGTKDLWFTGPLNDPEIADLVTQHCWQIQVRSRTGC